MFCKCVANRSTCRLKQAIDISYSSQSLQEEIHEYFPRIRSALSDSRLVSDVLLGSGEALQTAEAVQLNVKTLGRIGKAYCLLGK